MTAMILYTIILWHQLIQLYMVAASYQNPQGTQGESDPNNTTVRYIPPVYAMFF